MSWRLRQIKIVKGDFDINISYKSKDEMGSLANAFRDMAVILGNVISDASRLLEEMAMVILMYVHRRKKVMWEVARIYCHLSVS